MSKQVWTTPEALQQLLNELQEPRADEVNPESKLVLIHEELGTLTLTGMDVCKVLSSVRAVDQLFETLERENECTVELTNFDIQPEVGERLEELFDYVEIV
jgi:hypothetical protein